VLRFVPAHALAEINRGYPAIDGPAAHDAHAVEAGHAFHDLVAFLESDTFRDRMSAKFGVDLTDTSRMSTVRRFAEPSDGAIHTDSTTKIVTALIYFNESWDQPGGRLRVLRSATDIDDYAAEIVPCGGTLFAFRRCDWSWHGFPPCSGERRSLQMHFVAGKRAQRGHQDKNSLRKHVRRLVKRWWPR
jgi:hypothetical protein